MATVKKPPAPKTKMPSAGKVPNKLPALPKQPNMAQGGGLNAYAKSSKLITPKLPKLPGL